MKYKRKYNVKFLMVICLIAIILLSGNTFPSGSNSESLSFKDLECEVFSKERSQEIWEIAGGRYSTNPPSNTEKIESFAVNEDGMIAVAYEGWIICVYDQNYNFEYAIAVDPTGIYGVDWVDGKLAYIDYRASYAILICDDGTTERAYKFTNEAQFKKYFEDTVKLKKRTVNGYEYHLIYSDVEKFKSGQMSLIRTSNDGNTTVLYSYTYEYDNSFIFVFLFSPLIIACIIIKATHRKK